jgi:DNA-binding NtrC family response regulator
MDFPLIGVSDAISEIKTATQRDNLLQSSVVISGESGVGKELVARHCYTQLIKNECPFIKVDYSAYRQSENGNGLCHQIMKAMKCESSDRRDQSILPSECVLFIDEIEADHLHKDCELPQVLKHRSMYPPSKTGGGIWILAAINTIYRDSLAMQKVEELKISKDVVSINIPPLRQRAEDISPLFDYYWDYLTSHFKKQPLKRPNNIIMEILTQYRWPGNIQELQQFIKDALSIGDWYKAIEKYHII